MLSSSRLLCCKICKKSSRFLYSLRFFFVPFRTSTGMILLIVKSKWMPRNATSVCCCRSLLRGPRSSLSKLSKEASNEVGEASMSTPWIRCRLLGGEDALKSLFTFWEGWIKHVFYAVIVNRNSLPFPSSDFTEMSPPKHWHSFLHIDSPIPFPYGFKLVLSWFFVCRKPLNTWF